MTNASPRLTTPFDEHSIAEEVLADVDLSGRRAIVTGASSGIGTETARVLALRGAAVTLTARDLTAGETVAAQIRQSTGNRAVGIGRPSRPHSVNEAGEITLRHNGRPGRWTGRGRNSGTCTWKYLPL